MEASEARAQGPASVASGADKSAAPSPSVRPVYRGSVLAWEHTLTAATVGVGRTPQSFDPTYSMGFAARPRYFLLDNVSAGRSLSVRADAAVYREFTNSDATTRRGEWALNDTDLALQYGHRLRGLAEEDATVAELRPLTLTLPSSKASFSSGRYFAPGVLLGVTHVSPLLRGLFEPELTSSVRLALGYRRWFARATVPTSPSLERVRLGIDGRSLPSDTLSGASLVRDQLDLSATLSLAVGARLTWTTTAGFSPAWKYRLQDDVEVCGVTRTGCTRVPLSPDDTRYLVRTSFATEFSVRIAKGVSVAFGYGNATSQLGSDARRRGLFYSPDAVFFSSVSFSPHELATGNKQFAESGFASPAL